MHSDPELLEQLRPEIRDSWQRCRKKGIIPNQKRPPATGEKDAVQAQSSGYLNKAFTIVSEQQLQFLDPSYAIFLFDKNANVLDVFAAPDTLNRINQCQIGKGTLWAEELAGTNAASLGLALAKPVAVVGCEHYCRFAIDYACAFAPIVDKRGTLIGGIGILGPASGYSQEMLGIARMASFYLVEKITADRWNDIINASITEGVVAIDEQDRIVYMSSNFGRILKFPAETSFLLPFSDVIDKNKPENHYFWSILKHGFDVQDEPVVVTVDKERIHFTATIKPLILPWSNLSGRIMVIQETERINRYIKDYVGHGARIQSSDIIGNDPNFVRAKNYALMAASSGSNILLIGESGTGKDFLPRPYIMKARGETVPFWPLIARLCPESLLPVNYSVTKTALLPGPEKAAIWVSLSWLTKVLSFWMRLGTCHLICRPPYCASSRKKRLCALGAARLYRLMFGL
jgi:transcriptional regulator of acetoin/glycerol metabolism